MTLIAKGGPSTGSDDFSNEEASKSTYTSTPPTESTFDTNAPPSYAATFAGDREPTPGTSLADLPKPSNYVQVFHQNGMIKGTWAIDTNFQVPAAFIPPPKGGEKPDNLSLVTRCGAIYATIYLQTIDGKRADLKVDTQCGQVNVQVPSRIGYQPFRLHAVTRTGAMFIGLPRDYNGPLKHKAKCGTVKFSDDIQKRMTTFGSESTFVGQWDASQGTEYERWLGDEVDAMSACGNITFLYADEMPVEEPLIDKIHKAVDSTVKTLFGWVGRR